MSQPSDCCAWSPTLECVAEKVKTLVALPCNQKSVSDKVKTKMDPGLRFDGVGKHLAVIKGGDHEGELLAVDE